MNKFKEILTIGLIAICEVANGQGVTIHKMDSSDVFFVKKIGKVGLNLLHPISEVEYIYNPKITSFPIQQDPIIDFENPNASTENFEKFILPQRGRNFKGNQMSKKSVPPDNSIAISNNGIIVSVDNQTIHYRNENGDSISMHVPLFDFIDSSTSTGNLFDPKVIYDNVADRFIFSVAHKDNDFDSTDIAVAFSVSSNPSDGWNLYILPSDTMFTAAWFDRPNIGINSEDLYITGSMFSYVGTNYIGNSTFQLRKEDGYAGSANILCKHWKNIKLPDNTNALGMHPMSYGQEGNYGPEMYFVSNLPNGGDSIYFHKLIGNCSNPIFSYTSTSIFTNSYSRPLPSLQQTSLDSLRTGDCRITDGFFLNDRCHVVFSVKLNGFSAIRYQRINVLNNTTVQHVRGFAADQYSYSYPCIASFGSTVSSNDVMIGYLRNSPFQFPSVAVVNFDGSNWSGSTIVKNGNTYVNSDLIDNDVLRERWGDYMGIQRKYNSLNPTVWLIGCYGDSANYYYNLGNGWSSWICEIGNVGVGLNEVIENLGRINIFPNPSNTGKLQWKTDSNNEVKKIEIYSLLGDAIKSFDLSNETQIDITGLRTGVYIVKLITTFNYIQNEKIHIRQ